MSEPLRLSKLMAQKGLCSRREADHCIQAGWVLVDGTPVTELGSKVVDSVEITLTQAGQEWLGAKLSLVIYKPVGYVSAQAEPGYKPAVHLLESAAQIRAPGDPGAMSVEDRKTLAPAGRLDIDSRGLLLMTQDGRLAKAVIQAETKIDKEYRVHVNGQITEEKLRKLRYGLQLDGRQLQKAKVSVAGKQRLQFVLREGRKRQIRRMCEAVDLEIVALVRERIGPVRLRPLEPGQWRYLSKKEVFELLKLGAVDK